VVLHIAPDSPTVATTRYGEVPALDATATLDPATGDTVLLAVNRDPNRTTQRCYITVAPGYVPNLVEGFGDIFFSSIFDDDGGIKIGPIPPDTPVGLLASLNLRPEGLGFWERVRYDWKLLGLVKEIKQKLKELPENASDDDAKRVFVPLVDSLIALSKCPDYVVNRGHYFGTGQFGDESRLTEQDKRDLIEFLKTF
jgi:hypothetical protein